MGWERCVGDERGKRGEVVRRNIGFFIRWIKMPNRRGVSRSWGEGGRRDERICGEE
jgi:hypothetical protein